MTSCAKPSDVTIAAPPDPESAGEPFRRRAAALLRQESGIAAVEFSLILPILVLLWIGGVEVTGALSVDRRCNNLAAAIGDLVARDKKLVPDEIDAIFDITPGAMFPHTPQGMSMRVSAVKIDEDGDAKIAWSQACKMQGEPLECVAATGSYTAYADNTDVNNIVAASLRIPESQIIMSEVYYTYTPTVGYVITGSIELDDRMFFVPRLVPAIQLCDAAEENCKS